jgi:hypothetical protein
MQILNTVGVKLGLSEQGHKLKAFEKSLLRKIFVPKQRKRNKLFDA